ncbi:MAG TPA: carboxypeptidase-like regulatory domain-containing protein [Planctomycetota bacterium]|nr:carboxypeptidase-like regulatory domain-containing protein [Planctomycetota bacterium]
MKRWVVFGGAALAAAAAVLFLLPGRRVPGPASASPGPGAPEGGAPAPAAPLDGSARADRRSVDARWTIRVEDSEGAPVAGAEASLGGTALGRSGSDGLIELSFAAGEGPAPGSLLEVVHPEHLRWSRRIFAPSALEVVVLRRARLLALTVLDADGTPLAGATCMLVGDRSTELSSDMTDELGECELSPGELDVCYLSIAAAGHAPHWSRVAIPEGRPVLLEVALERGRELEVTVLRTPHFPVEGAQVTASWIRTRDDEPAWQPWRAFTPSGGTAVLRGLPPRAGALSLEASAAGLAPQIRSLSIGEGPLEPQTLVLETAARLEVRIEDSDGVSYDGRVALHVDLDAPARIERGAVALPATSIEVPAERGARIEGMPAGVPIALLASVSGGSVAEERLVLEAGEERLVAVIVPRLVPLRVSVFDAAGEPVEGRVVLRAVDGRQEVQWAPPGLVPAGFPLSFQEALQRGRAGSLHAEPGYYSLTVYGVDNVPLHRRELGVHEASELEIRLGPPAPYRGRLEDQEGRPLAGWTLTGVDRADPRVSFSAVAGDAGGFLLQRQERRPFSLLARSPSGALALLSEEIAADAEDGVHRVALRAVRLRAVQFESGRGLRSSITLLGGWMPISPAARLKPLSTRDDGTLSLTLPDGERLVRAVAVEGEAAAVAPLMVGPDSPDERVLYLTLPSRWRIDYGPIERGPATVRWSSRTDSREATGEMFLRRASGIVEVESFMPEGPVTLTVADGEELWSGSFLAEVVLDRPLRLP